MKLKLLTAAMLAMAIAPMQANAVTATGTINVTATVVAPTATVNVAGPLAFGNVIQGSNGGASATTSYDVTVSNGVAYTIQLLGQQGQGSGISGNDFQMLSGPNAFLYAVYKDATKGFQYSANPAAPVILGRGSGIAQTLTLYAETLVAVGAGNYTDTITITVAY